MANKCKWCKSTGDLVTYETPFGEEVKICKSCYDSVKANKCRKCGEPTPEEMMLNGLCSYCLQVAVTEKSKQRENMIMDLDEEGCVGMTEDELDGWLTYGTRVMSPAQMRKSPEIKRLWALVKLLGMGYSNEVIEAHMELVVELLERNFNRLMNRKCKVVIEDNNPKYRKLIRELEVVDHSQDVYILYTKPTK